MWLIVLFVELPWLALELFLFRGASCPKCGAWMKCEWKGEKGKVLWCHTCQRSWIKQENRLEPRPSNPPPNNGMQRTRIQQVFYHRSIVRAADAQRYVASLMRIARQESLTG